MSAKQVNFLKRMVSEDEYFFKTYEANANRYFLSTCAESFKFFLFPSG
jgi:hypothetical protein